MLSTKAFCPWFAVTSLKAIRLLLLPAVIVSTVPVMAQQGLWREHISYDNAYALLDDDGFFYCIAGSGLVRYSKADLSPTFISPINGLPSLPHAPLVKSPDGQIWTAARQSKLLNWDGTEWRDFEFRSNSGALQLAVTAIAFDNIGNPSIAATRMIARYENDDWQIYDELNGFDQIYHDLTGLAVDANGATWAIARELDNTSDGIVIRIDASGRVRSFRARDGLPALNGKSTLRDIVADPQGRNWICGFAGVALFDGQRWHSWQTQYNPALAGMHSRKPLQLLVGEDETIWVRGEKGISRYDGNSWQNFTADDGLLFETWISKLTSSPTGEVWAATDKGLHRFDNGVWELRAEGNVSDVVATDIEVLTIIDGVPEILVDDDRRQLRTPNTIHSNLVLDIAIDKVGKMWFAYGCNINTSLHGTSCGLGNFDGKKWELIASNQHDVFDTVMQVAVDNNNVVWMTAKGGLNRFDGDSWRRVYINGDTQSPRTCEALAIDSSQTLWLSSFSSLGRDMTINSFDGSSWQSFVPSSDRQYRVEHIAIDRNGVVWATAGQVPDRDRHVFTGGLLRFDGKEWTEISLLNQETEAPLYGRQITFDEQNRPVIIVNQIVARFDGNNQWFIYENVDNSDYLRANSLAHGLDGSIWFSQNNTIRRLDDYAQFLAIPGFSGTTISSTLFKQDGSIWIVSSSGVYSWEPTSTGFGLQSQPPMSELVTIDVNPHPLQGEGARIRIRNDANSHLQLDIVDIFGRLAAKTIPIEQSHKDLTIDVPIDLLAAGLYFVVVHSNGVQVSQPIVIRK